MPTTLRYWSTEPCHFSPYRKIFISSWKKSGRVQSKILPRWKNFSMLQHLLNSKNYVYTSIPFIRNWATLKNRNFQTSPKPYTNRRIIFCCLQKCILWSGVILFESLRNLSSAFEIARILQEIFESLEFHQNLRSLWNPIRTLESFKSFSNLLES